MGPTCMWRIGWWPSLRFAVAVRPTTKRARTAERSRSNETAGTWWHSSTTTCPYWPTRSSTASPRTRLCIIATSIRRFGLRVFPPILPISAGSRPRCRESCSTHWSSRGCRWTRTRVERERAATSHAPITVFPVPGGETRTPVSCSRSARAASSWRGVSLLRNDRVSASPSMRSSSSSNGIACAASRAPRSTTHPRGRETKRGSSSEQLMTRGVRAVERRRFCFLKNSGF